MNNKNIKIKHINFRKIFIQEHDKLVNYDDINRSQEIKANNVPINIEVSAPMTRGKMGSYIKKL